MSILLPYQSRLWRLLDSHSVVVCEKSRRIGMTWAAAAYAVMRAVRSAAQGGSDVLYIGYNLEMTTEFLAAARQWTKAIEASSVKFTTGKHTDTSRSRLEFRSGHAIKALSSRPRSLRGRQGFVIIDEAAFHEDLPGLMKAAMALLIWQGKLLVISTHFGRSNHFFRLIQDIQAKKYDYAHLKVSFADALEDGLYRRIARMKDLPYSVESEAEWAAQIRADYGEAAAEELDCIAGENSGQYLPRAMLEETALAERNILRYRHDPKTDMAQWRKDVLLPHCANLPIEQQSHIGVDFGRHHDLSVFYVLQTSPDLSRQSRLIIELAETPFEEQWETLKLLIEHCPRLGKVAMDKGGIGGYLHEKAEQTFGSSQILGVQLSRSWYAERMPKLKAALEQKQIVLPRDSAIIDDLCQIAIIDNIPRPLGRKNGRHADSAIALVLAHQASQSDNHVDLSGILEGKSRVFTTGF